MFSGSANPSFHHPEFTANAAGRDVNIFNFPGPLPASDQVRVAKLVHKFAVTGINWLRARISSHRPLTAEVPGTLAGTPPTQPCDPDAQIPTPDSRCTPSPSSSQPGAITIVSLRPLSLSDLVVLTTYTLAKLSTFEVEPQRPKLPYITIPQVFFRNMLKAGKGVPCWKPEPRGKFPTQKVTKPGDAGTFTEEGGFKKIWNIWEDANALQQSAILFGHTLLGLPPRNVTTEPEISQGRTINMGASSKPIRCPSDRE